MDTIIKKTYTKPEVSAHRIDKEISLVMMTFEGEDPPPFPTAAKSQEPNPTQKSNFEDNPFGE